MRRSEFLRATLALVAALTLTVFGGALLGYDTNPAASRATHARIAEYEAAHSISTPAELDAFYDTLWAEAQPEAPPAVIAILQCHQVLLAWVMLAALLVSRPGRLAAATVSAPAVVLLYLAAGLMPGLLVFGALVAYLSIATVIPRLSRRGSPGPANA